MILFALAKARSLGVGVDDDHYPNKLRSVETAKADEYSKNFEDGEVIEFKEVTIVTPACAIPNPTQHAATRQQV